MKKHIRELITASRGPKIKKQPVKRAPLPRTPLPKGVQVPVNCRIIQLTKGWHALVNAIHYSRLMKNTWRISSELALNPYAISREGDELLMHRAILHPPPDVDVDHINGVFYGDPKHKILDNRRRNLRPANDSQNQSNHQRISRRNVSGAIGVHWAPREGKWRVQVTIQRHSLSVGLFDSLEEARDNRDFAAQLIHAEFAFQHRKDRTVPYWDSLRITAWRVKKFMATRFPNGELRLMVGRVSNGTIYLSSGRKPPVVTT